MSLPFDDWIYHLSWKRDEVNNTHSDALKLQQTVQENLLSFNADLDLYKKLIASNALLLIINSTVTLSDLDLKDYNENIKLVLDPVEPDPIISTICLIANVVAGDVIFRSVFNFGKVVKNNIFKSSSASVGDMAAETAPLAEEVGVIASEPAALGAGEVGAEVGAEVAGETIGRALASTLKTTGLAIFIAVGVDVIFGLINGAKEEAELDKILDDLKTSLGKVQTFKDSIDNKSAELKVDAVKQITLFKNLVESMKELLPKGHKPMFDTSFEAKLENLQLCIDAQGSAIQQFSLLSSLRDAYLKGQANGRMVTVTRIVDHVLDTAPDWATEQILMDMYHTLEKYSDQMKNLPVS